MGAVPLLSCPGIQPPWASEVGPGLWQGSEGLLRQGLEQQDMVWKECSWDVVVMRGTGNKGTGERHMPQGERCSSEVGCKSRAWQV